MGENDPQTRRSVVKKGLLAATTLTGGIAASGTASAAYDHELRVETGSGGGRFRGVIPTNGGAYETENVENTDLVSEVTGDLRVEFDVSDGPLSPGYDIIRWNGGDGETFSIGEYNDSVNAYLDGELISHDTDYFTL